MLRITEQPETDGMHLLLEGRLIGPWVSALRTACESASAPLTLDLAGVDFSNLEGLRLLEELRQRQVRLLHASPLLQEQLRSLV
jgi:hypothetical protein